MFLHQIHPKALLKHHSLGPILAFPVQDRDGAGELVLLTHSQALLPRLVCGSLFENESLNWMLELEARIPVRKCCINTPCREVFQKSQAFY